MLLLFCLGEEITATLTPNRGPQLVCRLGQLCLPYPLRLGQDTPWPRKASIHSVPLFFSLFCRWLYAYEDIGSRWRLEADRARSGGAVLCRVVVAPLSPLLVFTGSTLPSSIIPKRIPISAAEAFYCLSGCKQHSCRVPSSPSTAWSGSGGGHLALEFAGGTSKYSVVGAAVKHWGKLHIAHICQDRQEYE